MNVFLGYPPASIEAWIKGHKPTPPTAEPLCFTAEEDGSSVRLVGWARGEECQIDIFASLQYSTDNATWQEWDGHVINLAAGEKVYIKALNPNPDGMIYYDEGLGYATEVHKFIFEGKIAGSGSIQYLLEDTGSRVDVPEWAYCSLFNNCTSLTAAPYLPATTLASNCYDGMFQNCTSLTTAPKIATYTPDLQAFDSMFYETTYSESWTSIGWGDLTSCNWPDLTLLEVESLVLNDGVFGWDGDGYSGVRINITCKDGNGVAYFDPNNWTWVFEY